MTRTKESFIAYVFFLLTFAVAFALSMEQRDLTTSSRPLSSLRIVGKKSTIRTAPCRKLSPPFPNGSCGGRIITIPPEDTYGIDTNLATINLGGGLILPPRPIYVWLPPDYDKTNVVRRHPVLYVHDGQNAWHDESSWTGTSWRLLGALVRMADHQLLRPLDAIDDDLSWKTSGTAALRQEELQPPPLPIVVLLPSASDDLVPGIRRRHLEYGDMILPWAKAHVDFVAQTVKPLMDQRFATNPSPQATYTIGTSLGGQASLHLLVRYPDLFGGAACMSPAFGPTIVEEVKKHSHELRSKKIYLDIGGDVDNIKVPLLDVWDHVTSQHWWNPGYFWLDTQLQGMVHAMKQSLDQAGVNYVYHQVPGGRHNERAWAYRIDKPLLHLFGRPNLLGDETLLNR